MRLHLELSELWQSKPEKKMVYCLFYAKHLLRNKCSFEANSQNASNSPANSEGNTRFKNKDEQNTVIKCN